MNTTTSSFFYLQGDGMSAVVGLGIERLRQGGGRFGFLVLFAAEPSVSERTSPTQASW